MADHPVFGREGHHGHSRPEPVHRKVDQNLADKLELVSEVVPADGGRAVDEENEFEFLLRKAPKGVDPAAEDGPELLHLVLVAARRCAGRLAVDAVERRRVVALGIQVTAVGLQAP